MTPLLELQTFAPPDIEMERRRRRHDRPALAHPPAGPGAVDPGRAAQARRRASRPPSGRPAGRRRSAGRRSPTPRRCASRQTLAQAFRTLGLGPDRPVMILSGNSLEHLLVSLGAYAAGRAGDADQRGLLAAERRPRPDQGDRRADGARAGVRRRRRPVREGTRRARAHVPQTLDRPRASARRRSGSTSCCPASLRTPARSMASPAARRSPNSYSHQDRPASPRASSTPTGCCARTRPCSGPCGRSWPTSRRCWSTGCRGAIRSAAITTSTSPCSTAGRSTSTTAGRRRRCFRARSRRSRTSLPRCTSTSRPGTRCSRRRSRTIPSSPSASSAGCASCSTPRPRCPTRWPSACASWPRSTLTTTCR